MHDPTKFSNFYFSKKKTQHSNCSLRFKVSIHKVFHQHNARLKLAKNQANAEQHPEAEF